MTHKRTLSFRFGLALLAAGTALAAPAVAQQPAPFQFQEPAGSALTRHLRTLSDQPRSLSALMGAGKAALELGDPQAALTFFARAEEVAPRDGRVKAGMASAFVQMEQPAPAMKFFQEASSLGIPEAEFAGDRGLAHDLAGDPRRAQADYNLSLRRQENAEIRRRLALSLAISGQRDQALAAIDQQLRAKDRAAWRVRSFILALTGDAAEATRYAQSVMPMQAAQMQPFFARLPSLNTAERAMAVHFGHFPNDGRVFNPAPQQQYASAASSVVDATRAGQPDGSQSLARRRSAPQVASTEPRRRPGTEERRTGVSERPSLYDRYASARGVDTAARTRATLARTRPTETKPAAPAQAQAVTTTPPPAALTEIAAVAPQNVAPPIAETRLTAVTPPPANPPIEFQPSQTPAVQPIVLPPSQPALAAEAPAALVQGPPAEEAPRPGFATVVQQPVATAEAAPVQAAPAEAQPLTEARRPAFADIAAAIASLPAETAAEAPTPAKPTQLAQAEVKTPPKPAAAKPAAKKEDVKTAAAKKEEAKPATDKKADIKTASAKKGETKTTTAKKTEEPKEASRHWVQIAGGANKEAMTKEFARLKSKAPKLLASRTPWTAPLRATNRLLVGPFKTTSEAQAFVNELAKLDLSAFSWTSPAGQEIVKLAAK